MCSAVIINRRVNVDDVKFKLNAFFKSSGDSFDPKYIDPRDLSRDEFLEQCGNFWDNVEEFLDERE